MIDLTTIQTYEVPPPIDALQKENTELKRINKTIKAILFVAAGFAAVYVIYKVYKSVNNNRKNVNQKLNRSVHSSFNQSTTPNS